MFNVYISTGPSAPSARSWGRGTGRRGPTRGVMERRCPDGQQWNVSLVRGYGVSPTADHFTSHMRIVSKVYCKIWQKDFAKLLVATQELIFRYLQLTYQWERTEQTDREMLAHMSAMHRSWRSKQKKRHFNGKPLDDVIASVPAGVDPSDWQTMCELWTTGDERRIADRNKQNRATQSMPYRRGRTSHYHFSPYINPPHSSPLVNSNCLLSSSKRLTTPGPVKAHERPSERSGLRRTSPAPLAIAFSKRREVETYTASNSARCFLWEGRSFVSMTSDARGQPCEWERAKLYPRRPIGLGPTPYSRSPSPSPTSFLDPKNLPRLLLIPKTVINE
ncbi:hypothetical protein Taro_029965 [Colocasia esculenta]|uniref:Uncharacterized protein n=1 Tax=Colocasia esculenta TaxID=4460 RepID=A0A843VF50_COLES|nr:hypothetical protein [Colocasia esculenta]